MVDSQWRIKKLFVPVCALILSASVASADVISDWNIQAGQTIAASMSRRGPSSVVDVAMVHLAMHDAVRPSSGGTQPYCIGIANASGSPVAAASKAARDVLVGLFPAQETAIHLAYPL